MRINLTSVLVDDQDKALRFYTEVLGFVKKTDIPMGEARWLTVVSPEDPDGTELLLEPDAHPAAGPFKAALVEDGIPFTSFAVDDVEAEYERLDAAGRAVHPGADWRWARSRPPSSTTPAATSSRSPARAERVGRRRWGRAWRPEARWGRTGAWRDRSMSTSRSEANGSSQARSTGQAGAARRRKNRARSKR